MRLTLAVKPDVTTLMLIKILFQIVTLVSIQYFLPFTIGFICRLLSSPSTPPNLKRVQSKIERCYFDVSLSVI